MVEILEVVVYSGKDLKQRIIPDVNPVMSSEDVQIWKRILTSALKPFYKADEKMSVYITYQTLIDEKAKV